MIHRHFFAFGLLVLLFPAALPPVVTVIGGAAFGIGFWLWLPFAVVHWTTWRLWRKGLIHRVDGHWEVRE